MDGGGRGCGIGSGEASVSKGGGLEVACIVRVYSGSVGDVHGLEDFCVVAFAVDALVVQKVELGVAFFLAIVAVDEGLGVSVLWGHLVLK